ncbi:hypothetical protein A7X66_18910 [Stenotrophomonas maltophilia]|nr:hypothetical protein A7X66_18910 [Stenotrophomonas maltophilia]
MAWIHVSTKVDTYQKQAMLFRQFAEICRRRGGSGCGGVRGMDAAAKLTGTYLQRLRNRTHPAIPQETSFCCCFGCCF